MQPSPEPRTAFFMLRTEIEVFWKALFVALRSVMAVSSAVTQEVTQHRAVPLGCSSPAPDPGAPPAGSRCPPGAQPRTLSLTAWKLCCSQPRHQPASSLPGKDASQGGGLGRAPPHGTGTERGPARSPEPCPTPEPSPVPGSRTPARSRRPDPNLTRSRSPDPESQPGPDSRSPAPGPGPGPGPAAHPSAISAA